MEMFDRMPSMTQLSKVEASAPQLTTRRFMRTSNKTKLVRIAQFGHVLAYLPLYIALKKGYFKEYKMNVTIVNRFGDHTTWQSVCSEEAEFGVADPLLMVGDSEIKGVVIASLVQRVPMHLLTRRPDIIYTKPTDFAGKNICVYQRPSTSYALIRKLADQCVAEGKAPPIIREIEFTTELGYLSHADVDAVLMVEPAASMAEINGAYRVFDGSKYFGEMLVTGLFGRLDYIEKNPDVSQSLVNGLQKALNLIQSDRAQAVAIARKEFPEVNALSIELGVLRLIAEKSFPRRTVVSENAWYALSQLRGQSASVPLFRDFVNNRFANSASEAKLEISAVLSLNPNLYGIGFDLPALLQWFRSKLP